MNPQQNTYLPVAFTALTLSLTFSAPRGHLPRLFMTILSEPWMKKWANNVELELL